MKNYIDPYTYAAELNCRILQVLSVFRKEDIKVEWLFYNTLVSFSSLYNYSIIKKKRCFGYDLPIISSNLQIMNIEMVKKSFEYFLEAKEYILEKILAQKVVFARLDSFYFKHREFNYKKIHDSHSYMLCGYNLDCDSFLVQDYGPSYCGFVGAEDIRNAYEDNAIIEAEEKSFYPGAKSIVTYDIKSNDVDLFTIGNEFTKKIMGYYEDLMCYDLLIEDIKTRRVNEDNLFHLFNLMTVTRSLFTTFLQFGYTNKIAACKYELCFKKAKFIRDSVKNKSLFSCTAMLTWIKELKQLEDEAYKELKNNMDKFILMENKFYKHSGEKCSVLE